MKCFVTIVVGNNYRGLDSDSATGEEIKTTIRFFSDVLTGTRAIFSSECPIQCLDNVKAISLIESYFFNSTINLVSNRAWLFRGTRKRRIVVL